MLELAAHLVEKLIEAALLEHVVLPCGALRGRVGADVAAVLLAVVIADEAVAQNVVEGRVLLVGDGVFAPVQPLFVGAGHKAPQIEHIAAARVDRQQQIAQVGRIDSVGAQPEHLAQIKALCVQIKRLVDFEQRAVHGVRQIAQGHELNGVFQRAARGGADQAAGVLGIGFRMMIGRINLSHGRPPK